MLNILLFTDAATSSQCNIAIGAFLCIDQGKIESYAVADLSTKLANEVIYQEYVSKKSTWAEIKTVIDALEFLLKKTERIGKVEIYTDCQSLCDLLGKRKEKLLQTNFITRTGKTLQNAELYRELFAIAEKFQIQTFKVKGHQSVAKQLSVHEKIFAVLDKLTRKKLRALL